MKLHVRDYLFENVDLCDGVDTGKKSGPTLAAVLEFCGENDCGCWQAVKENILTMDSDTLYK